MSTGTILKVSISRMNTNLHMAGPKTTMVDSPRARARVQDTESMMTVIAAGKRRAAEVFELEVEVLLTASARSLADVTTVTTVATVADAMTATGIMRAMVIMTVTTVADAVTGAEIVDARIMDTRTTPPSLIRRVTDHLSFSAGRSLRRNGITKAWNFRFGGSLLRHIGRRRGDCVIGPGSLFCFSYST